MTMTLRRHRRLRPPLPMLHRAPGLDITGLVDIGIRSGRGTTGMQVIGRDRRIQALTGLGRDITLTVIIAATGAGSGPVFFEPGAGSGH